MDAVIETIRFTDRPPGSAQASCLDIGFANGLSPK
jgi:hypothetical protein